jgi:hypothetical protein
MTDKLPSVGQLKLQREDGQVTFNNARSEASIDPAAPENYQAVRQEYERLDDEYKRTNILLEQDIERAEDLKDKLETTTAGTFSIGCVCTLSFFKDLFRKLTYRRWYNIRKLSGFL